MTYSFLVTGATGFIGSSLCRKLIDSFPNCKVTSIVRSAKRAEFLKNIGCFIKEAELHETEKYSQEIQEADYIFHIGANALFKKGMDYNLPNIVATQNLVNEASKSAKLKRFVFTSTIGAVDRSKTDDCSSFLKADSECYPSSTYGESKLKSEQIIKQSNLSYTIVRPPWVYGPGMRFGSHIATLVRMSGENILSKINFAGRVSVIYLDDMVDALIECAKSDKTLNKTIFVTDDTPRSFGEIFSSGAIYKGVTAPFINIPSFFISVIRSLRLILPFQIRCLVEDVLICENTLGSLTGWKAKVLFDEGINKTCEYVLGPKKALHIVTGAASGIGLSFAKYLAKEGKDLLLVDRSQEVVELAKNLNVKSLVVDLSKDNGAILIESAVGEIGLPLGGLINCAGVGYRKNIADHSDDETRTLFFVNVLNLTRLTQYAVREFTKLGGGYVINVASSIATVPLPGMALYAASKAAVFSLGLSLWGELQGTGIKALTVLPSGTKTLFQSSAGVKVNNDGKGLLDPDDVVQRSFVALKANSPFIRVGFVGVVLALITDLMPRKLSIVFWKMMFSKSR